MITGFSTGSLALGDFRKGISMLAGKGTKAIELSCLRESEFIAFMKEVDSLDLTQFEYISCHAPSKLHELTERQLVDQLKKICIKNWLIIAHPDIISDYHAWNELGFYLCIENMDKRKKVGRTTSDLERIFYYLPQASFCLDVAHARQVDPTMVEAFCMIEKFQDRLVQLHVSDVNSQSGHEPITLESIIAYKKIAARIPNNVPIIVESPVSEKYIEQELRKVSYIFDDNCFERFLSSFSTSTTQYYHLSIQPSISKASIDRRNKIA